jgi:hypothetical protein
LKEEIVNKIERSGLVTLEMKSFKGAQERSIIDIQKWLFKGLILKEKYFRSHLKEYNWEQYKGKYVAIFCSADTIIPVWAYMLVANYLKPYAKKSVLGDSLALEKEIFEVNINQLNPDDYIDKKILIKGCSDTYIPEESFVLICETLMDYAKSLKFGEACSNVPIFRKKN